jgi:hypothetical protein
MRLFKRKQHEGSLCPRCSQFVTDEEGPVCPMCGWDLRETYDATASTSHSQETPTVGSADSGRPG